jgi:S1-C subfamily serine protease
MPGSDAAKAGLQKGDVITSIDNSAILLSIADVQWALHNTLADGGALSLTVIRNGATTALTLHLPKGWRDRDDISWRASTWGLRRKATGGIFAAELTDDERLKAKLSKESMGLIVQHVGQFAPHNIAHQAGVRKGDILLSFDGKSFPRETDLIAYSLRNKMPGDSIELLLLRDGQKKTITFKRP